MQAHLQKHMACSGHAWSTVMANKNTIYRPWMLNDSTHAEANFLPDSTDVCQVAWISVSDNFLFSQQCQRQPRA